MIIGAVLTGMEVITGIWQYSVVIGPMPLVVMVIGGV